MEVITIQSEAFQQIISKIESIGNEFVKQKRTQPLSDIWLDVQEACQLLKISKRTLQSYRDNGVLPFSQIAGKIYFKATDIEKHLQNHYKKTQF
ncbi:MAG: helix-turn-helix domain-containing protein [Bacteroidales bacterium]|jgi:excisionase family DNA binding protein